MKLNKKLSYQNIFFFLLITSLLFGINVSQADLTVGQYWGELRNAYVYILDQEIYDYTKEEPLTTNEKTITMWNVSYEGDSITFRTDLLNYFLSLVRCDSEECYEEYKKAWNYNSTDDSILVSYKYHIENQEIGFIDPLNETEFLQPTLNVPVDPIELGFHLFFWYGGVGYTFLPVLNSGFSFKSDFDFYEQKYPDFEIKIENSFRFQGKKFEGFSYDFSYTEEFELGGVSHKIETVVKFAYNSQGVLYTFHSQTKYQEKMDGKYDLTKKSIFDYSILSYDEDQVVSFSWYFGLSALIFTSIVSAYRMRKRKKNL